MNPCSQPSLTYAINQVSLLIRNTYKKSSVKRNACKKLSATNAANQVLRGIHATTKWYPWNNPNVMRNAYNNSIVIHAINQVSKGLHATSQMLFMQ